MYGNISYLRRQSVLFLHSECAVKNKISYVHLYNTRIHSFTRTCSLTYTREVVPARVHANARTDGCLTAPHESCVFISLMDGSAELTRWAIVFYVLINVKDYTNNHYL